MSKVLKELPIGTLKLPQSPEPKQRIAKSTFLFAAFRRGIALALDQFDPAPLHFGGHFCNHLANQFLLVGVEPVIDIARPFRGFFCVSSWCHRSRRLSLTVLDCKGAEGWDCRIIQPGKHPARIKASGSGPVLVNYVVFSEDQSKAG